MNFQDALAAKKSEGRDKAMKISEKAQNQITRHPVRTIIEPFRVKVR
jgi:hypothetical protein